MRCFILCFKEESVAMNKKLTNAANGNDFQKRVENCLRDLLDKGYLTDILVNFRIGEPGFGNDEQYYAPFLVQFNDRTRWILFTTTSLRTDRIKGQQWDADRLKQLDTTISKAFLIYPDDIDDKTREGFIKQKEKYDTKQEFSRIDDILPVDLLIETIKVYDDEFQKTSNGWEASSQDEAERGRIWDFNGRVFERDIAQILSNNDFLLAWKNNSENTDFAYDVFKKILQCLKIDVLRVSTISATSERSEIGLLPSGGSPKTDVFAVVTYLDGKQEEYTFSCKRSTKKVVSAHQYSADAFADVLDSNNERLRFLLNLFQYHGNQINLSEEERKELTAQLSDKLTTLCKWVVGGHGGAGSSRQLANYIVTFQVSTQTFSVHTVDQYVELLLKNFKQAFGTPFYWTYASGTRGKSIQLKMPVL